MMRSVAVVALLALLVLVLYLPSAYPPQRFLDQLRADHIAATRFWGNLAAHELLEATLARQTDVRDVAPLPNAYDAPAANQANRAVAREMSSVNDRLFNSLYFRSADAMLLLATYRGALSVKWLIWLAPFPVALGVDSLVRRRVKALEFLQHDPELFAALICGAIANVGATILLLVLPLALPPFLLPLAPLLALSLAARSLASFPARHR